MMVTAKRRNKDRGQALLVLAFGLLALAAFAGLAIDGGRLYVERRQTQNAADASALAGARVLAEFISTCASADIDNDNRVAAAVVNMAKYNGVDHFSPDGDIEAWYVDADLRPVGRVGWAVGIPNNATGIKTTLTFSDTATFMRLLGTSHLVSVAEALAMVGPVVQTQSDGGILPIAVTAALLELAANYRKGDILYWLIFDKVYTPREMEKTFPGQAPAVGWMTAGGPTHASYYHIVGFTAVELVTIDTRGGDRSITGSFKNVALGEGMIDPGSGMGSGDKGTCHFPTLIGVKLWK